MQSVVKVGISYCGDDHGNKAWVKKIADQLNSHPDIEVIYDNGMLPHGTNKHVFMAEMICLRSVDKVIFIFDEPYVKKANNSASQSGVTEEWRLALPNLRNLGLNRYIYVSRSKVDNGIDPIAPSHAMGLISHVFLPSDDYEQKFLELRNLVLGRTSVRNLLDEIAPELFSTSGRLSEQSSAIEAQFMDVRKRINEDKIKFTSFGAETLRLWGSESASLTRDSLLCEYKNEPLMPPVNEREGYQAYVLGKEQASRDGGFRFFNGPSARLFGFHANPPSKGIDLLQERESLVLQLAPVGWYEYSFLNGQHVAQRLNKGLDDQYLADIGIETLLEKKSASDSKLSNIVPTATTIVTNDGFIAFQIRGKLSSAAPGRFTSSVAENIQRYLDDPVRVHETLAEDTADVISDEALNVDNSYVPIAPLNPFDTVSRGLNEEVARTLSSYVTNQNLRLLGIGFDLIEGHPVLLFAFFVNLTREQLENLIFRMTPKDFYEGRTRFLSADISDQTTNAVLSSSNWIEGGRASVLRTLEFIDSMSDRKGGRMAFERVHARVRQGESAF